MAHVPPFDMPRSEIRDTLDTIRHPFRVAIDRAKNPFNIGAIIRTAHSFLAREIILIGSEPWYPRAAMGMQRYENIVEIPSSQAFVDKARQEGWPIVAFEKDASNVGLWEAELPEDARYRSIACGEDPPFYSSVLRFDGAGWTETPHPGSAGAPSLARSLLGPEFS